MPTFKTLDEIIRKACAFNPEKRFRDANELKDALDNLNKSTNAAYRRNGVYQANKKILGGVSGIVLLAIIGGLYFSVPGLRRSINFSGVPPAPTVRRAENSGIQTIVNKTPLPKSNTNVVHRKTLVEAVYIQPSSNRQSPESGIYLKYSDGSKRFAFDVYDVAIANYASSVSLSPDKKRIVYALGDLNSAYLSLQNINGGDLKKITLRAAGLKDCEPFWIDKNTIGFKRIRIYKNVWDYFCLDVDEHNNGFNLRKYGKQYDKKPAPEPAAGAD